MAYSSDVSNQYRQLSRDLERVQDEVVEPASDVAPLMRIIRGANSLVPAIEYSIEAHHDAQLVYQAVTATQKRVRNTVIGDNAEFDTLAYVDRLAEFIRDSTVGTRDTVILADFDDSASLTKLGEIVYSKFRRPATAGFMVGPTDLVKKTRKVARSHRFNPEKQVRPYGVTAADLEKDSRNETTKMVLEIYKSLKTYQDASEGEPIALFDFILNPQSFAQSVENLFYTSFLVRDGKVALDLDQEGIPVISIVDDQRPQESNNSEEPKAARNQVIIDLDYELWKNLCSLLGRDEPLIETRPQYSEETWME